MKKKIITLLIIALILWIGSFFLSIKLGIVLAILGVLIICTLIIFLIMNKHIKKTNWWKNQYLATQQFVSNNGYRDNMIRNYDIVNLGSNPAHFAFFYENVSGQSWATGSQGQDMDFEILKYFHSYIKKGGTVLIPIIPFTAISTYLKDRSDYWGIEYYSKFAQILDRHQVSQFSNFKRINLYIKYPILVKPKVIRYLCKDTYPDTRYFISEQSMMEMELMMDANHWIHSWLNEFNLNDLNDCLDIRWEKYYMEALEINKKMVEFCLDRNLKPVYVCLPMTKYLSSKFSEKIRQYLVSDFVKTANVHNIPFLDYSSCEDFEDPSLYFNSFFLNLRGRKMFTNKVLKDLKIYSTNY